MMFCRTFVTVRAVCFTSCVRSAGQIKSRVARNKTPAAADLVQCYSMAPKRKATDGPNDAPVGGKVPAKKLDPDVEFDSRWKQEKPSLLYLGDDLDSSTKIAAFDFDNTLVEWLESMPPFSTAPDSWEWWSADVPEKLKVHSPLLQLVLQHNALSKSDDSRRMVALVSVWCAGKETAQTIVHAHAHAQPHGTYSSPVSSRLQELSDDGYKIVIFSNQSGIKSALGGAAAKNFRAKVDSVLKDAGVQAAAYVSTMKGKEGEPDAFRKPATGMWEHFVEHCNGGVEVDKASSFYVGDAAGRTQDFSDSDAKFAEAIGVPFKTPEDVFGSSATLPTLLRAARCRKGRALQCNLATALQMSLHPRKSFTESWLVLLHTGPCKAAR